MSSLSDKYYIRRANTDSWEDITTKFQGVNVLSLTGLNERGDTVNIFTEQWVSSQAEDYLVTTQDQQGNNVVVRKNVDLSLTFICGTRYGASDTQSVHDNFVNWITKNGDFYIKSEYTGKQAHVICLKAYKPTTTKLQRGTKSYIMGTLELHTLDAPSSGSAAAYEIYIGLGGSSISSMTDINNLTNKQHYDADNVAGNYSIVIPSTSYLWICTSQYPITTSSSGFIVPLESPTTISTLKCYRSSSNIVAHTMSLTIST